MHNLLASMLISVNLAPSETWETLSLANALEALLKSNVSVNLCPVD